MGLPHFSNFAPNATMYHATGSQTLNISDYIDSPFLLEKVVLEVPAEVHRVYDKGKTSDTSALLFAQNL